MKNYNNNNTNNLNITIKKDVFNALNILSRYNKVSKETLAFIKEAAFSSLKELEESSNRKKL